MARKIFTLFAVLVLAGTVAWAKPPLYVSFASDDYHEGPTFTGYGAKITAKARVDLMLDQQGDFEGGVVIFPSWFTFEGEIVNYQVIPWGGNFLHIWDLGGSFSFNHYDVGLGSPFLLGTKFDHAVLTSISPNPGQAGETMTLQDAQSVDGNVVFGDGGPFEAVLNLTYPNDYISLGSGFAFTFTHVRVGDFVGPPPLLSSGKFKEEFKAEGSFSGEGGN
ncbi:MAG: hypothetical protein ABUT39_08990 [Acidobacteriota bacterium]